MLTNVEHIGIAVKDLKQADELFRILLNTPPYKHEEVQSESVLTSFFRINQTKVELLQATESDSAISKFIDKRGEGVHHIAFEVDDIYAEMERLEKEGFVLLNKEPKYGADNKLVCFVHPKSASGVLVELCQEIKNPSPDNR